MTAWGIGEPRGRGDAPRRARLRREAVGQRPPAGHRAHADRAGTGAARERPRLEAQTAAAGRDGTPALIAESAAMRPVLRDDRARRAVRRQRAHHRRERHRQGARRAGAARRRRAAPARPMVTINAGGVSEGVFESELFGHVKGAFTDAKTGSHRPLRAGRRRHAVPRRDRQRPAEPAAEAPARARDRRVRAAGVVEDAQGRTCASSRRPTPTSTPRSRRGRFRQDLLFRLNTVEIRLPPLRDRRDDIPLLAAHFLRQSRAAVPQGHRRLRARTRCRRSRDYAWPGNVRELDHAVERAVLMAQGDTHSVPDLALRPDAGRDAGTSTT